MNNEIEERAVYYGRPGEPLPMRNTLKTVDEICEQIPGLKPETLAEMAEARLAPHWRIDGSEPLFKSTEIREWVQQNLTERCTGKELPVVIRPVVAPPRTSSVPTALAGTEQIMEVQVGLCVPGVYFLIVAGEIVYVGQSRSVAGRVAQHAQGRCFDSAYMIPVPPGQLNAVEGALIRLLKPKWNHSDNGRLNCPAETGVEVGALQALGLHGFVDETALAEG